MKKWIMMISLIMVVIGCGSSSEDFKYYKGVRVQKDGSISYVGEALNEENLPVEYHKVLCDKNRKVKKAYFISSGVSRRSENYLYNDDGKIDEVRHYVKGKYNGVSKYIYGKDGKIETEEMYDENFKFLYSKKL